MGKRGPKPKPTAIRLLEGNPGRMPINPSEITCAAPAVMPSVVGMDEHAAEEWRRILASMPPDVYTALDVAMIAQYALAWSMLIRAQQELDMRGLLIEFDKYGKDGDIIGSELDVNPALKAWKAASDVLLKTTDRLGLSPGVRARLQIPSRGEQPASKFAGLIKQ